MRELTTDLPKPMIAVRGKTDPAAHRRRPARGGRARDFLLVVGYRAEVVRQFFGDGAALRRADRLRGRRKSRTAPAKWSSWRGILSATEPFVLSYGDIMVEPENYRRLVALEDDTDAIVSVKHNEDVSQGGAVFVNERFELIDLREKPQPNEPTSPGITPASTPFARASSTSPPGSSSRRAANTSSPTPSARSRSPAKKCRPSSSAAPGRTCAIPEILAH